MTLLLIAEKNSQVTANAFNGRGGNIDINAEGLFLLDSPQDIFSASSELGIDGTVRINTPDIDLQRELEQSELEIYTTEEAVTNSCLDPSTVGGSSFTINNNPGLPYSPDSHYSELETTLTGMKNPPPPPKQPVQKSQPQPDNSLIPATRMVKTSDGRVLLIAGLEDLKDFLCPQN